ncbi:hypothetical protein EJ04DRAFT_515523 [Polyplosphaeria fusca]|uniref:Uncharacterized protein n=1 Tax=Polyplosphaeria fusca TaxID=682080 RepID=A0A9P4QME2_9PLEO|nr:hypothetical protein EJ04DRAFT_515523 [Polyplosphaeria fusca]
MDPPPPTAPPTAHNLHHQPHHRSSAADASPCDPEYTYNEKDAFSRQQNVRGSKGSRGGHDSVISHPFSPKASSPPSPSSSISSAGRKHRSIDQIHFASPVIISAPPRARLDPEKAHTSSHGSRTPNRVSYSNPDVTAAVYDSGEYHEKAPQEKAVQLQLFLSAPCALLSLLITIWTTIALFIAVLLWPFRLCTSRPALSSQITTLLAPPLNLQLHLVYSSSSATEYSAPMLAVVNLFSPVVAVGVAIAAWTAAFFWFFSAILGDPAGQDGHNDGRDSIVGVRNWWDRWLSRALR